MGEVLSGSTIGDSAFCAGGRFIDGPVKPPDRSVVRIVPLPRRHPDDHLQFDSHLA